MVAGLSGSSTICCMLTITNSYHVYRRPKLKSMLNAGRRNRKAVVIVLFDSSFYYSVVRLVIFFLSLVVYVVLF